MGRLGDSLLRLREDSVGFRMDETMVGEHELAPGFGSAGPPKKGRIELCLTWGPSSIARWLTPTSKDFLRQPISGTITAEGLCVGAPCEGTLELLYLKEHKIRYLLKFEALGRRLNYEGEKVNIRPWNLHVSHTTCLGRITEVDSGALVSTSVVRFRLTGLPRFLLSLRVTRHRL